MSESGFRQLHSAKIDAGWHTVYVDVIENARGPWLQITETRKKGTRQSVLLDSGHAETFQRELLKAVSVLGGQNSLAADSNRARAYDPWTPEEDRVLTFLFRTGAGMANIANALQRERGAVRSRLKHLGIEVNEA